MINSADKIILLYATSLLCGAFTAGNAQAEIIRDTNEANALHQQATPDGPQKQMAASETGGNTLLDIIENQREPLRISIPNLDQEMSHATPERVTLNWSAAERHLTSLLSKPFSFAEKKHGPVESEAEESPLAFLKNISNILPAEPKPYVRKPGTIKAKTGSAKKELPKLKNNLTAVSPATLPWVNKKTHEAEKNKEQEETLLSGISNWFKEEFKTGEPAPTPSFVPYYAPSKELAKANAILPKETSLPAKEIEYSALKMPVINDAVKSDTLPSQAVLPWLCEIENQPAMENKEVAVEPDAYVSPGAIIKRQHVQLPPAGEIRLSPERLAALAPAAGAVASDAIEPLIQLPETPPEPVSPAATIEAAPALPAPVPAPTNPAPADLVAEKTVAIPEPITDQELLEKLTAEPSADASYSAPPSTLPKLTAAPPQPEPPKEPMVKTAVPGFAKGSNKIITSLTPIADERPKEPRGFVMDRAKDTSGALEEAKMETVTHEAEGVNIAVKSLSINPGFELEKAYNALISGQSAAAAALYERVLAYEPANIDALFGLATIYHRTGQIDKARPLYGKILSLEPEHREAMNNFLALLADEAPEAALQQLEILEKKSPGFSPIPAQMAVIYQKQGDYAKAGEKMLQAVALAPENLTYRYNLAILLDKQGNYAEAKNMYELLVQAHSRGETLPGSVNKIQERLTFLRSNTPK